jgi:hypothetical protein
LKGFGIDLTDHHAGLIMGMTAENVKRNMYFDGRPG